MHWLLVFVAMLGACTWVGGFVVIVVVTRVARSTLESAEQVAFFRALGRAYGVVGGTALAVALVAGGLLLADREWDGLALAAVVLASATVIATWAGVVQARGMTRLRAAVVRDPENAGLALRVRRHSRRAAALRAAIGALSIGLLAVAAAIAV